MPTHAVERKPLRTISVSDVSARFGMPAQIPASAVAGMRQQGVNAGSGLRRLEDELRFAALLRHGIVRIHSDASVSIPVTGHADAEHCVISGIDRGDQPEQNQQSDFEKTFDGA